MSMMWQNRVVPSEQEREIAALTREGAAYAVNGLRESVALVNEQLAARGAPLVAMPGEAVKQVRKSTQAASRRKAQSDG